MPAVRPRNGVSTKVTATGFQAKPVNRPARSHSVNAQAPASARTSGDRLAPADPPGQPGGKQREDGEVERHKDHGDPAEPGRHRRLVGEGGRDPVEADDELAEAEQPAGEQRPLSEPARATSSHSAAKANGISGHQPTGSKAKADRAPATKAMRKCIGGRHCEERSDEAIQKPRWIASLCSQ